jgi:Ca2+-binding EF-hand superfamily protein
VSKNVKTKTLPAMAACLIACVAAVSAIAAPGKDDETQNLFISPSGEPFLQFASKPYPIVDWFKRVDTNGDGKIDKAEFSADAAQFFKTLDRNGDGVLSSEEVYIYEHYMVPEILNGDQETPPSEPIENPDGTTSPPKPILTNEGAAFFGLLNDPEPVMSADRNFDFRVTRKEFLDQADRHFAMLDPKGKGYFTLDDLPKTPFEAAMHARRTEP